MTGVDPTQNQLQLHTAVPVVFPLKGVVDAWGRETQPPATTPDALNVVPYDLTGRARGGVRAGTTNTLGGATYGSGGTSNTFVQGLYPVIGEAHNSVAVGGGYFEWVSVRFQGLILIAGGKLYYGTAAASTFTEATYGGSRNPLVKTYPAVACVVAGTVYIAQQGRRGWIFNPASPSAYGDASAFGPLGLAPRTCCNWRNRLVVAGTSDGSPQNVYLSKMGDPENWTYGTTDPAGAFVINEGTKTGQIGDPVTALVPLNDNQLLVGADRALWLIDGDPADGGRAGVLNDGNGIIGPTAWCMSDTGDVYFVGGNGLGVLRRGSLAVENLSGERYASYFAGIVGAGYYWSLVWDLERHGCWIFRSSPTAGTANVHLWWDDRTQSLWPIQFPAGFGPTAAGVFDDATLGRTVLFGGWAGNSGGTAGAKVYRLAPTVGSDDGAAISSYVQIGPLRPYGALQQGKLTALDVELGEVPAGFASGAVNVTVTLQADNAANAALTAPRSTAGTTFTTPGRQSTFRSRMSATDFFVKLSNATAGKVWSMEEAVARFVPGGRPRA